MTQEQVLNAENQNPNSNAANVLVNGAKLVGESILPGTSLLLDGKFVNGAAHAAAGIGARIALGPIGVALICADSFSKSVTNKFLWDHVSDAYKANSERRAAAKAAKTEAQAAAEAAAHSDEAQGVAA
jgi:hypothetical protein